MLTFLRRGFVSNGRMFPEPLGLKLPDVLVHEKTSFLKNLPKDITYVNV